MAPGERRRGRGAVTDVRVSLVDVYVVRPTREAGLEFLLLRRAGTGRCPGTWETVHGHIEGDETPVEAALRELREETGLEPERLMNASRVEMFYRHTLDEVSLIPVFAALVPAGASVACSAEHDRHAWVPAEEAATRLAWPRERRMVRDVVALVGPDGTGVQDVLAIDPAVWQGGPRT